MLNFFALGLVHCYISSKRMSEAIMFAEEALRLMPNCSRALSLVALALIDTPTHENQVERVRCKRVGFPTSLNKALNNLTLLFSINRRLNVFNGH